MNKKITYEKVLVVIFTAILLTSILFIYINENIYLEIYTAVSKADVEVADVSISNITNNIVVYVTILVTNPSNLDIKFKDIGGHIKLNNIYLGQLNFEEKPQVIGKKSFNITILGVYKPPPEKIGIIHKALKKGNLEWEVYGWASFEVSGQWLMIEYRGVIK